MKVEKICGIYRITNIINKKCYIGQSTNINRRITSHKNDARHNSNLPIHRAIRKYGEDNFLFEVITECLREDLNKMELYYIDTFNSMCPNGYNIAHGSTIPIKLKESYVLEIIDLLKNTELTSDEIGKIYGVSGRIIRGINSGENWYEDDFSYPIREYLWKIKSDKNKIKKECEICGKEFVTASASRRFCSQICCHKSQEKFFEVNSLSDCMDLANKYKTIAEISRNFGVSDHCVKDWFTRFNFDFVKYKKSLIPVKIKVKHILLQIDVVTKEIINEFNSPAEAALKLGIRRRSHISEVCSGKLKQAYGYIWKYKEE